LGNGRFRVKALTVITASGLAVGGLYAGGAFARGEVYDLSLNDARMRLEAIELTPESRAVAGGSTSTFAEAGNELTWNVLAGSRAVGSFRASLTAEGPKRTRVLLSYRNGSIDGGFGDRLMSTRFMRSYAETSFYERVDAALDGRPVDPNRAMQAFAANAAAHPEQIKEVGLVTREMFASVDDQLKASGAGNGDDSGHLYARQPTSARESMAAATQPNPAATRPTTSLPND